MPGFLAADTRARIQHELDWQVRVPEHLERVVVDARQ